MAKPVRSVLCWLLLVALPPVAVAGAEVKQPSVFDLPALQATQALSGRAVVALFARGDYAEAEKRLRQAIERVPHDASAHYNLACALARLGKTAEALGSLE